MPFKGMREIPAHLAEIKQSWKIIKQIILQMRAPPPTEIAWMAHCTVPFYAHIICSYHQEHLTVPLVSPLLQPSGEQNERQTECQTAQEVQTTPVKNIVSWTTVYKELCRTNAYSRNCWFHQTIINYYSWSTYMNSIPFKCECWVICFISNYKQKCINRNIQIVHCTAITQLEPVKQCTISRTNYLFFWKWTGINFLIKNSFLGLYIS